MDPFFAPVRLVDQCLGVMVHRVKVTAQVRLEPVVVLICHGRVPVVFVIHVTVEAQGFSVDIGSQVVSNAATICS